MSEERTGYFMETFTGRRFYLTDPRVEDVCIEDIAHHLARICRYNGAINTEHYSVAEHSCLMAKWVLENFSEEYRIPLAMVALFHDAAEAYTGDIIYPLKRILGDLLRGLEKGIQGKVVEKFLGNLDADDLPDLLAWNKDLDLRIRVDEWKALKSSATNPRADVEEKGLPPLGVKILSLSPNDAEQWFLDFYDELIRKVKAPEVRRGSRNPMNWQQGRRYEDIRFKEDSYMMGIEGEMKGATIGGPKSGRIVTVRMDGKDPKVAGIVESIGVDFGIDGKPVLTSVEAPDAIRFKPGKPVIPAEQFSVGYDLNFKCAHLEIGPHKSGADGLYRCARCGIGGAVMEDSNEAVVFVPSAHEPESRVRAATEAMSSKIYPPKCEHSSIDRGRNEFETDRCNDCGAHVYPSPMEKIERLQEYMRKAKAPPPGPCPHGSVDKIGDEAARCNDCGAAVFPPTTPITVSADGHVAVADGKGAPGIPMQIICPGCHDLHIDKGEFATKPHHTHACQNPDCGLVWRPALVNTVGVRCLPGFLNEGPKGRPECAAGGGEHPTETTG